jgi:uncharacterized membrane protein
VTDSTGMGGAPTAVPNRRLRVWLVLSLAINLLVIGAIGGSMFAWHRHGSWRGGRGSEEFGLLSFARTLPADRRAIIRKSIQAELSNVRPLWEDVQKAHSEAAAVLVAEPFEKDKFKAAIDKITEADSKLKAMVLTIFINTAERLTPDERQELRVWWERRRARHFGSRFGERSAEPKDQGVHSPP